MLSAATNAKHEARLSSISSLVDGTINKDLRLKAWPRGFRPLRRSFASFRMTQRRGGLTCVRRFWSGEIRRTVIFVTFAE